MSDTARINALGTGGASNAATAKALRNRTLDKAISRSEGMAEPDEPTPSSTMSQSQFGGKPTSAAQRAKQQAQLAEMLRRRQ